MKRRIALIYPAEPVHDRASGRTLTSAQLMVLASLMPNDFEIAIFEEQKGHAVDFNERVDLACISMMTNQAPRGYDVADTYRRQNTKVVIGGIHASVLPDEALQHADAVVVGEAEPLLAQVLDDVLSGRSEGIYRAARRPEPGEIRPFAHRRFSPSVFNLAMVQSTRGCPYDCDFCSVTKVQGHQMRARPVTDVIEEILSQPGQPVLFLDDNIVGNPKYAKSLFHELVPLRRRWVGQASLATLTSDDELLPLMRESGCTGLVLGVESLDTENLRAEHAFNKSRPESRGVLESRLRRVHDAGIMPAPWIIFGFDHDDPGVFGETVAFARSMQLPFVGLPVCTPYPGTALHARLEREGRILDRDWRHYDAEHAVFRPALMTPELLRDGAAWASYEYYRWPNVLRRAPAHRHHLALYLAISAGYHFNARKYRPGFKRFQAARR